MEGIKIINIYTGNRGFRKYIDNRKTITKPVIGFKEILADALRNCK